MSEELDYRTERKVTWAQVVIVVLLIGAIALSIFVIRPIASSPGTYTQSFAYLDEKMDNAKMLSLGSSSAAFIVSLIPDDAGTPIANELAKFSGYLLAVLSAIFLEKYLLTSIGYVATMVIIPLGFLIAIPAVFARSGYKAKFREYATRLIIFGICVIFVIPLGCKCGRMIEETNAQSIETALNDARNANEIVESVPDEKESKNIFEKVGDFFTSLWGSTTAAYEWAKTVLSNFMSSIAVMFVTTIIIPILMFLSFFWLLRFLTKRDFVVGVIETVSWLAKGTRQSIKKV